MLFTCLVTEFLRYAALLSHLLSPEFSFFLINLFILVGDYNIVVVFDIH